MTEHSAMQYEGKPGYELADLRSMSVADLKARIGRISNQQARHIAVRLWQLLDYEVGNGNRIQNTYLDKSSASVHQLAEFAQAKLVRKLNIMRTVYFGQMIAAGPEFLDEYRQEPGPSDSIFFGNSRAGTTFGATDKLLNGLERFANIEEFPGESIGIRSNSLLIIPVMVATIIAGNHFGGFLGGKLPIVLLIMAVGVAIAAPLIIKTHSLGVHRILALYISFTDEFMDDERAYDEPVLEDTGW